MTWKYEPVDEHDRSAGMYWIINGKECEITIEKRPHYCDRGNWIAKIHAIGSFHYSIDHQDGWPRYYFELDRAKLECEAWLHKRGQWIDDESNSQKA